MWNNSLREFWNLMLRIKWNEINPLTPAGISHCEAIFHTQSVFHKSRKGFISLKKTDALYQSIGLFLVEMARFELASEDPFPKLSTSVVYLLKFLLRIADKQAKLKSSPLSPYKLQGSHLCRCTAKMTPLTESRYFQSGWAAIKQQLKLFYYCQLFLSCDFYSGATPLLAYLGSKSPSKSFHPRI